MLRVTPTSWMPRLSGNLREPRKQFRKHRLGTHPTIEAVFEFLHIAFQMLGRHAGMRPGDGLLEVVEEDSIWFVLVPSSLAYSPAP